ncbi:MAG: MFS transporter [Ferruginibacter sp.]
MEKKQRSLQARRISISLYFFFFGFIFATWASRIPNIQQRLNLSEAGLGAVLLTMPVGSFITLPFSGYLASKIGSRQVIIVSSIIYSSLLIAIGFSQNTLQLTICLFLFGSAGNMMNISINTQAIALEILYKKTIISSFHGMWSVAGLIAASLGTFLIGKAFPVPYHFVAVALISLCSFLFGFSYLLHEKLEPKERRPLFTKPEKAFLGLGVIAFCSMICQGAMFDWSGVYFKKVVNTETAFIGLGYTAFMISMTTTRFITDWLTHKIGFKKIIALCGISTTAGLLMTVLFPYLIPATIGLLFVGIGVSPAVPLVFSAAGKFKILPPAMTIAAVSSIGMIGQLIGPPIIGFIASATSLKISFLILSFFGIAITVTALIIKKQE